MRDQALKFNRVESGEYVKPKSWAKQGQRDVICRLFPDGELIIEAELSDYSVIWYSETNVSEVKLNAAIFDIIKDTCYEPNNEWYCSPLYKVLAGIKVPYRKMDEGMKVAFRIYKDRYNAPGITDAPCTESDKVGEIIAERILAEFNSGLAKCSFYEASVAFSNRLKALDDKIRYALSGSSDQVVVCEYGKIKPEIKEIASMEFIKLSKNADFRNNYISTVNYSNTLYNKYMTIVR